MRASDLLNRLIRLPIRDKDDVAAVLRRTKTLSNAPHWIEVYETVGDYLPPVTVCVWNGKFGVRWFVSASGQGWTTLFSYPTDACMAEWADECDIIRLQGEDALLRDMVMLRLGS